MLIDLDVVPHPPPARPHRRRRIRPALLVAALPLTLLAQGAARPARLGELKPVANFGNVAFSLLTGDALYLATSGGEVAAVPLPAGGPRWSVRVGDKPPDSLSVAGSMLMVRPAASFLDIRTGRERWRAPTP